VPLSPDELARDATACVVAGAGSLHVYPRLRDGRETLHAATCDTVVAAIRASVAVPLSLTTGLWIDAGRVFAIERWAVTPELCSVNVREEGTEELCRLMLYLGIGVEAGLASAADVDRIPDVPLARVLVEVEEPAEAERIDTALDRAGVAAPRLYHGYGAETWEVLERAASLGRDVRIGLEDTLVLRDGSVARDNAELVSAAVTLVG
jgi:uncharacterized protein (DUF849 family)